ncbi:MAG: VOC family protein [Pseudomonadota bacterium]
MGHATVESISAITLATHDMARAVRFYRTLGFSSRYGGEDAPFTSFEFGQQFLNLILEPDREWSWWGRVIFYVSDVDALYETCERAKFPTEAPPRDAPWGERFFHVTDPDSHELSFAKLLSQPHG